MPSIDWQPPTTLPDLRRVGIVALDLETKDDGLRADRGSAWPWHGGYVCGVGVAYRVDDGIRSHYSRSTIPTARTLIQRRSFSG
jgi:hypothetical protein